MWALKNSVLVSMSTVYLNFDRRETRLETVVLVSRVCKNLSNMLWHTFLKRVKLHYKSFYIPPMNTVPQGGQRESLCEGNGGRWSLEFSAEPSGNFLSGPVVITVRSSAPEERSLPPVAALGTCCSWCYVWKSTTRPSEHHRSAQQ